MSNIERETDTKKRITEDSSNTAVSAVSSVPVIVNWKVVNEDHIYALCSDGCIWHKRWGTGIPWDCVGKPGA